MNGHNWKYSPRGFWYCTKCKSVSNSHKPDRNVKVPDHKNAATGLQKELTCEEIVIRDVMES